MNESSTKLFIVLIISSLLLIVPKNTNAFSNFYYTFNSSGSLLETGSLSESTSSYWWLNSGGLLNISNDVGQTIQGSLPTLSTWRVLYSLNNPIDTDNGYHPQNIFRLVNKILAQDVRVQSYFLIKADELSSSPNRNSSNGLLLFSRYQTSSTLYYTGVRVDGYAVIKKKINGTYYTLATKKIFFNPGTYDKVIHPNLIPKNTWIGLRSETKNNADGTVSIKLFTDIEKKGIWTLVLEATDNGVGGDALTSQGYTGIRTDFMDVQFDNYKLENI
jgi:hypothetical protein